MIISALKFILPLAFISTFNLNNTFTFTKEEPVYAFTIDGGSFEYVLSNKDNVNENNLKIQDLYETLSGPVSSSGFYLNKSYKNLRGKEINQSILIFDTDTSNRLLINPEYFSSLIKYDSREVDGTQKIGIVKQKFIDLGFSCADVAKILMEFGVIETYSHLRADMRIIHEIDNGYSKIVYFKGTHHYCTNDCYEDDFKFAFKLDYKFGNNMMSLIEWNGSKPKQ